MAHRPRGNVTLTGYSNRPESLSYFLCEMKTIRESKLIEPDEFDFSEIEEANAEWLKKAGFETYVNILEDTQGDDEPIDSSAFKKQISGLPQSHEQAIRKRMHTLRTTIRSRHGREGRRGSFNVRQEQQNSTSSSWSKDNHHFDSQMKSPGVQLVSVEKLSTTPPMDPPLSIDSPPSIESPPKSSKISSPSLDNLALRGGRNASPRNQSPPSSSSSTPPHSTIDRQKSSSCDSSPVSTRKYNSPPNSLIFTSPKRKTNGIVPDRISSSLSLLSSEDTNSHHPTTSDMKLSFSSFSSSQITELDLPDISLEADDLGITKPSDLSQSDLEKVACLAHIELSVTFEEKGIPLRTLRPKKLNKSNDEQLFGVPLSNLMQNDQKRNSRASIPIVFKEMIEYLETSGLGEEGLLRVSGSKQRAKAIQEELESSFNNGNFSFEGKKPSDISSLLKQFIRDLPVPLLTMENLPAFALLADIQDFNERLRTLNLLILMLPPLHQRVLKRLMIFCANIHINKEATKMDITNISMVLAPNLFLYLPASKLGCDDVALAAKTSHVVMLMIKYHRILWTVPSGMLRQVRFLYESELKKLSQRHIKQALQKMTPETPPPLSQTQETTSYVIRVQTPLFTCRSKGVNIQECPTAGLVVARVTKRPQFDKLAMKRISTGSLSDNSVLSDDSLDEGDTGDANEQFLYESGGNIGERRLNENTNMLALYAVNPNCSWILKPKNYRETPQNTSLTQ